MLQITVPAVEQFDERNQEFVYSAEQTLTLEHSLVSLSKWESKWHKPFLSKEQKTKEEIVDYVRCMTITQNIDPNVYKFLTDNNIKCIREYIDDPMTATTFYSLRPDKGRSSTKQTTSELIYYWMVSLQIPFECQKWHLNRLLTLIKICNTENQPGKKMSKKDLLTHNRSLNAARRKQFGTSG